MYVKYGLYLVKDVWTQKVKIGYAIISVDESRSNNKKAIRSIMTLPEITGIEFVDGRTDGVVDKYLSDNNIAVHGGGFFYGELGIWASQINCWKWIAESEYDAVIIFEDDASVSENFDRLLNQLLEFMPKDFDFTSLFVPRNQLADYHYDRYFKKDGGWELNSSSTLSFNDSPHYIGNSVLVTAYQGWGCQAMMYSKSGAVKLLNEVNLHGIAYPVDCLIFMLSQIGIINGYTPAPQVLRVVEHDDPGTIARATGMRS